MVEYNTVDITLDDDTIVQLRAQHQGADQVPQGARH